MATHSFLLKSDCAKEETIDNSKLNKSAHQKPSILMPSMNLSASKMINALMTNKNNPRVIKVMGKVRITNIGLRKVLSNASTNANTRAVVNSGMWTPLKTVDKP